MMKMYWLMCLVSIGCGLDSHGKDHCELPSDCLDGFVCDASGTCVAPMCTPNPCGAGECGAHPDGCGGTLECGTCEIPDHCTNGSRDADETDTDCGGTCHACATGASCALTSDCATGTCEQQTCLPGRWTAAAVMPTSRTMLAAVVGNDGLIYTFGGYLEHGPATGVVEVYNPALDSWSTRAPMPTPRYGLSAVVGSDGRIYTIGGQYDSSVSPSVDGLSVKVEAYSPSTNTWQQLPSLPDGRYLGSAVAASNGKIYASGGFSVQPITILGSVVSFAPGDSAWTTSDAMTTSRAGHGTVAIGNRIYAVGGYDNADNDLRAFEYYQPGLPGWNTLPLMPTARKMLAAATSGGRLYAIAGNAPSGANQGVVERYDPATNTWSKAASLVNGRFDHAAVSLPDGRIFILGGERGGDTTNTTGVVEVYVPDPS